MSVIYSSQGTPILIDSEDVEHLSQYTWSDVNGYFCTKLNGRTVYLHRLVAGATEGTIADHINHQKNDNRKANLRVVTPSQSSCNRRVQSNSSTGYKGVFFKGNRFRSYIRVDGKQRWVGVFDTVEEAYEAYKLAAQQYHGEFSNVVA